MAVSLEQSFINKMSEQFKFQLNNITGIKPDSGSSLSGSRNDA